MISPQQDINSKVTTGTIIPLSPTSLLSQVGNPFFAEALFDVMPDLIFFVKDLAGKYVVVNQTFSRRCGFLSKSELVGRSAADIFSTTLACSYEEQDQFVLHTGREIHQQLELRAYPQGEAIWCVTHKIPLRDKANKIIGLTGISRDLTMPDQRNPVYHGIASAVRYLYSNYAQDLQLGNLAQFTDLSLTEFERNFHLIFSITPRQLVIKLRMEEAISLLADPVRTAADIAKQVGYSDYEVFAGVFKTISGLSLVEYREMLLTQTYSRRRH